jgi:uncharacterized protein
MTSVEIVTNVYEAFARGDVPRVLASFSGDGEWRLAEGHPYAPDGQAWIGSDAIRQRFFMRAGGEWDGFKIVPRTVHDAGDSVVVEARYTGVYRPTGRRLDAQVCHVWTLRGGKVASFQQYVDTAQLQAVMLEDPCRPRP